MSKSLITVALSVYNNEKTVARAIKSVIYQTYQNWELIIVNDGSTDKTESIIKQFQDKRIKLIKHKHRRRLANSLNEIIDIAKGEYFARIDGDDYCYPERFEKQLNYMKKHPNVDLLGCNLAIIDEKNNLIGKREFKKTTNRLLTSIYIPHPTFFGKTAFFKKYRYNSTLQLGQDQDLLFRAYKDSTYALLDEILICYQEKLNIKKIAKTRLNLVLSRISTQKSYLGLAQIIIEQSLKLAIDTFAILTGLNYKILKHRCLPLTKKEILKWQQVKKQLEI